MTVLSGSEFSENHHKEQIYMDTHLVEKTLEAVANAIGITDPDGYLIWVNSAFTKLTGYEQHEAIGEHTRLLKSGKQSPEQYKIMWEQLTAGNVWHGVLINKRKDGREYYEEMTITPLLDEHGKPSRYIAIKQDVTERILREQQLLFDVNVARQIQKGALSVPIDNDLIEIHGLYLSSEELSGDMYAWYEIDKHKYGILLYDVMGHGLSAALVTMSIRSLLRGIITRLSMPEDVIRELNHHVHNLLEDNESLSGFYCTAIYVLVDLEKREIQYANAGHPPAFLIEEQRIVPLDKGCLPCGIYKKLNIQKEVIPYNGQAKIALYTDGLLEAITHSPTDSIDTLQHILYENRERNNADMVQMMHELLQEKHIHDDICFISAHIPADDHR